MASNSKQNYARFYFKGLVAGLFPLTLLALFLLAGRIFVLLSGRSMGDFFGLVYVLVFFSVFVVIGYFYKRRHGPMFDPLDRIALRRSCIFALGVATTLLPINAILARWPLRDLSVLSNIVLLIVMVPLSSIMYYSLMSIGSRFAANK